MLDRARCPVMWPCIPSTACTGNNTCSKGYDPTSERCARCSQGYYRLNGRCRQCPDAPWLIFVAFVIAAVTVGYVGYMLEKKQVNVGILSIGVDYFQVLSIFSNSNVQWPSTLVYLWNVMTAFNLNIDIFAPECWDAVNISYKTKWILVETAPLMLCAIASLLFLGRLLYKVVVQKRKSKLLAHGYKLLGSVIIIFYYLYLYISNTTLAVFNCQAPSPPDGNYYMQDVGTDEGLCYKPGTLQQELQPYAIICFMVYVLGFPIAVGIIIFLHRSSIEKDQLLRAINADKSQVRAAGTWNFRKQYQRLYYQFKPLWFFWILVIIARKFCLSVFAVLFRTNTIFMLSIVMLVLFVAYVVQVRNAPYMSMSEYDQVAKAYKEKVDTLLSTLPKRAIDHVSHSRRKVIKFGDQMGTDEARHLKMLGHHAFFNDYNTVEAVLLCSAVIVALSGIMFESGQLSSGLKEFVTYIVILWVTSTIAYFGWVLTTEVWIAFYPGTRICGCYDPWSKESDESEPIIDDAFEVAAGGKEATLVMEDPVGSKHMQLENAVLAETVAMQQAEIANLKKQNKTLELTQAAVQNRKPQKQKIQFGSAEVLDGDEKDTRK